MDRDGSIPFQLNNNIDKYIMPKYKNNIKEENINEERISFKLSLRKKKIREKLNKSRKNFYFIQEDFKDNNIQTNNQDFEFNNIKKYLCSDEYILSGKLYDDLNNSSENKNELTLRNILNGFGCFLNEKAKKKIDIKNILLNVDSSYNIKNNIKNVYFPLGHLLLKIGIETNDRIIYIYCFNFLLYFSSDDRFCKEIANEKNINDIFQKLIKFYPFIIENKKTGQIYKIFQINNDIKPEVIETYKYGNQTLKLLGNIFISSDSYYCFESTNFYEKIFYLLIVFDLDYEHRINIKYRIDYLDTLIWLIFIILRNVENIEINYKDKIFNLIPSLLNNINVLSSSEEFYIIEILIDIIEFISDINNDFCKKIVESDGINLLTNMLNYLYNNYINYEDESINDIIDRILNTMINIFLLDSYYLKDIDFSKFIKTFESLFNYFKVNHSQDNEIEKKLIHLLSVFACFDDIREIIDNILINKNIIYNLFQKYYEIDKSNTLLFIDNIMIKQKKEVKNLILDMGAFDIIKNNICNYTENNLEIIKSSISIIFKIFETEKGVNDKLFIDKIYKTSIPDKIKELYNNNIISNDNIFKLLIDEFDKYENNI